MEPVNPFELGSVFKKWKDLSRTEKVGQIVVWILILILIIMIWRITYKQ